MGTRRAIGVTHTVHAFTIEWLAVWVAPVRAVRILDAIDATAQRQIALMVLEPALRVQRAREATARSDVTVRNDHGAGRIVGAPVDATMGHRVAGAIRRSAVCRCDTLDALTSGDVAEW